MEAQIFLKLATVARHSHVDFGKLPHKDCLRAPWVAEIGLLNMVRIA